MMRTLRLGRRPAWPALQAMARMRSHLPVICSRPGINSPDVTRVNASRSPASAGSEAVRPSEMEPSARRSCGGRLIGTPAIPGSHKVGSLSSNLHQCPTEQKQVEAINPGRHSRAVTRASSRSDYTLHRPTFRRPTRRLRLAGWAATWRAGSAGHLQGGQLERRVGLPLAIASASAASCAAGYRPAVRPPRRTAVHVSLAPKVSRRIWPRCRPS